jgi:hypothetical protein
VSYCVNIFGEVDKMRKILESCPTCGGTMAVSELSCTVCDTVVRSRYTPCPFCRLSPEDLAFMLLFVRSRGNVKDMERELGVSYWTIRGRLNELIAAMGLGDADDETADPAPAAVPSPTGGWSSTGDPAAAPSPTAGGPGRASSTGDPAAVPSPSGGGLGRGSSAAPPTLTAADRQAILDRLKRGEITATEAAALLGGN